MHISCKYICEESQIEGYLNNQLNDEDLLDFLIHLDECKSCREVLYAEMKGSHDHYYRKKSSKKLEKEIRELSKIENEEGGSEDEEDITDVA